MNTLAKKRCVPCEGGVKPLTEPEAFKMMPELEQSWMLIDSGHMLARTFNFKDFVATMKFVNKVADIAEEEQHHPDMSIAYNTLSIELTTHAINGLSENDFILAAKIDEIVK